jgi:hypothetical protein
METLIGCIAFVGLLVVMAVLGILLKAFVLTKLWAWFIVPLFPGAPSLTMAQAYGIALVIAMVTHQHSEAQEEPDKEKRQIAAIVSLFVWPLLVLFVGWIVKAYWL